MESSDNMLKVLVPESEQYDSEKNEFYLVKEQTLMLEHSLLSISKWESKWGKPYISDKPKTVQETVDYIKCMTINKNVDPYVYNNISNETIKQISDYINAPMTATWFSKEAKAKKSSEAITSELIYYWMVAHQIPFECEKWHLNRLLTLIKVCNIKNQPEKKMSRSAILAQNKALNDARRKKLHTRG